jgi:hypothetical protein
MILLLFSVGALLARRSRRQTPAEPEVVGRVCACATANANGPRPTPAELSTRATDRTGCVRAHRAQIQSNAPDGVVSDGIGV